MNKMLLISEVAAVAREIETKSWALEKNRHFIKRREEDTGPRRISLDELTGLLASADAEDNGEAPVARPKPEQGAFEKIVDTHQGSLNSSQKIKIAQLLGQWEEPARGGGQVVSGGITVSTFRTASLAHCVLPFAAIKRKRYQ
jgi:hypothetical protein